MSNGFLIDLTLCVGCRSCQVACKQWNNLENEDPLPRFFAKKRGYQNPEKLTARNYCYVSFHEFPCEKNGVKWVFAKRQCMHCIDPACVSACLVGALTKTESGAVLYDDSKCIGCRYCMLACPFDVPTYEWDKVVPYIRKCTQCFDRTRPHPTNTELNGAPMPDEHKARDEAAAHQPACAKACPTGCIEFGDREALLQEARKRIADHPDQYVNHIYGEKEAGGTSCLYLSSVPFADIGFPATDTIGTRSYPSYTAAAMNSVPAVVIGVGAALACVHWLADRKTRVALAESAKEESPQQ